jgi:hypothetical protein
MGNRHLQFWREHGLDQFWNGEGFLLPGEIQLLSYQLAEILVRLIVYETRPRWFGLVREPHQKLLGFLRSASIEDHGLAACREHLGCGLDEIAAKFLGPGEWSKRSERDPSVT